MDLELLLFAALSSDFGIQVETNNPDSLRQKLYAIKRKTDDFDTLSFVISPDRPEACLWIVKSKESKNGQT